MQLPGLQLVPLDVDLTTEAAALRCRDGLALPDAIVLATGRGVGGRLLTNDRRLQAAGPDIVVVLDDAMQDPGWA